MTENYLHFIWKTRRLPFHLFRTTSGEECHIYNPGFHNSHESGPDFANGSIRHQGLDWHGNIEMHVKSSDWYKHGHQNDRAYDNVVLHVVYEHDQDVLIGDRVVPTIELKRFIDPIHHSKWTAFSNAITNLNCGNSLPDLDPIYLKSMMERATVDRLTRKVFLLKRDRNQSDPKELLYYLLAGAFGTKVNKYPFEELSHRIPLSLLKRFDAVKQRHLLYAVSGIEGLDQRNLKDAVLTIHELQLGTVNAKSWKRKGLRPHGYPEIRLKQFAGIVSQFDFEVSLVYLDAGSLLSYLYKLVETGNEQLDQSCFISRSFADLIIINCFVPFLWWYGDRECNQTIRERALELLELIQPEYNKILSIWKSFGIQAASSYESQALIELYNEYCVKNKCLNCQVGAKILDR